MKIRSAHAIVLAACLVAGACTGRFAPARPAACCAAPGSSRTQVEAVLGRPAPPTSSKWHPFPSPPPDAPIYTTEHGYLTVKYAGPRGLATHFSLDFYEGKAPDDALSIAAGYLPADAVDTHAHVVGTREAVEVFESKQLAKSLPSTHGMLYVECFGPHPATLCEKVDVALGSP